jgi:hypothetical protein
MIVVPRVPDIVDKFGTKWWKDAGATRYVQNKNALLSVWLVEELNGRQVFVLVSDLKDVLFESVSIDDISAFIERTSLG